MGTLSIGCAWLVWCGVQWCCGRVNSCGLKSRTVSRPSVTEQPGECAACTCGAALHHGASYAAIAPAQCHAPRAVRHAASSAGGFKCTADRADLRPRALRTGHASARPVPLLAAVYNPGTRAVARVLYLHCKLQNGMEYTVSYKMEWKRVRMRPQGAM